MNALTRLERADDLLADPFQDMFRRFFRRADLPALRGAGEIRLDVSENEKSYTIKAEIPGARKEDIRVQVDGNYVSISAEVRNEKETKDKNERQLTRELYYGAMSRAFTLDHEVDDGDAQAKFEQGVLTLTLNKRATSKSKTVPIQ